jgi:hypothetical protein
MFPSLKLILKKLNKLKTFAVKKNAYKIKTFTEKSLQVNLLYLFGDFPCCDEPDEVGEEGVGVGCLRVFAEKLGAILECRLKQKYCLLEARTQELKQNLRQTLFKKQFVKF